MHILPLYLGQSLWGIFQEWRIFGHRIYMHLILLGVSFASRVAVLPICTAIEHESVPFLLFLYIIPLVLLIWYEWRVKWCVILPYNSLIALHAQVSPVHFMFLSFPPVSLLILLGFLVEFFSHRIFVCTSPNFHLSDNFVWDILHQIEVFLWNIAKSIYFPHYILCFEF